MKMLTRKMTHALSSLISVNSWTFMTIQQEEEALLQRHITRGSRWIDYILRSINLALSVSQVGILSYSGGLNTQISIEHYLLTSESWFYSLPQVGTLQGNKHVDSAPAIKDNVSNTAECSGKNLNVTTSMKYAIS